MQHGRFKTQLDRDAEAHTCRRKVLERGCRGPAVVGPHGCSSARSWEVRAFAWRRKLRVPVLLEELGWSWDAGITEYRGTDAV